MSGIKLSVEIEEPVTAEDHDLLMGLTMILMALTNKVAPPSEDGPTPEEPAPEPPPDPGIEVLAQAPAFCSALAPDGERRCYSPVGHRGRHLFRQPVPEAGSWNN